MSFIYLFLISAINNVDIACINKSVYHNITEHISFVIMFQRRDTYRSI